MFSYSPRPTYKKQVQTFLESNSDAPMAVVFRTKDFPTTFMGRPVIDGDKSDWVNVNHRGVVVGLVEKKTGESDDGFVVDTNTIPLL